jgi:hypothetical protein
MALAFASVSNGSLTTTQSYPTTVNAGDILVWMCASKYDPNFVIPGSDWILIGRKTGGSGTGDGIGAITISAYYKIATGTEGGTTFTVTATSVNSYYGRVINVTKGSTSTVELSYVAGAYTGGTTSWSVSMDNTIPLHSGEFIVLGSAVSLATASGSTYSFNSFSGATISSITERADSGTSGGHDSRLILASASVTAGSGTDTLVYNMTTSAISSGATIAVKIKELPRVIIRIN